MGIWFFQKKNKKKFQPTQYTSCEVTDAKDIDFDDAIPQPRQAAYNEYASLSEVMSEASFSGLTSQNTRRSKSGFKKFTEQQDDN